MTDETYDADRARRLEAMLRALAERIREMDRNGVLLENVGELQKLFGDIRSELFHYEVRATYDTPEIAENRRLIEEIQESEVTKWEKTDWKPDEEDDLT
jgi:hypothetical protein